MTRHDWIVVCLLAILILIMAYFALIHMQTPANMVFAIVLLWAILPPIFSAFPYSIKYLLILPSPMFGAWFLLLTASANLASISSYSIIIAPFLFLSVVLIFHIVTRGRVLFWKFSLASLSRAGTAAISAFFIPFGVMLMNSEGLNIDIQSRLVYFAFILIAYVASSMLFVNSSYRYYVLSNRVKTHNLEKDLQKTWAKIKKRFPEKAEDCDLLQYYSSESLTAFLEGDYEKSFIWGYKVIREQTVVDPKEYVDDKRPNKPSFSDVRNTLEHSRRKGHVSTRKIRVVMGGLFDDSFDLVEREIGLLKKIAAQ